MELATVAFCGHLGRCSLGRVRGDPARQARRPCRPRLEPFRIFDADLWFGLMGLLIFYAKLGWVGGAGRMDIAFDGLMKSKTGFVLIDAIMAGEWEIFFSALRHIVLPACILGLHSTAYISRMTRSFMLAQLSQEYILTARVKGLSERRVIWGHAFKNILVQLLTIIALIYGNLLEGAVLIETVFAWPGLGPISRADCSSGT